MTNSQPALLLCDEELALPFADIPHVRVVRLPASKLVSVAVENRNHHRFLLVRSTFKVDADIARQLAECTLLSATAGADHLDLQALGDNGVAVHLAPGANARAVVEYVLVALACWLRKNRRHISEVSMGVVGCGNVGSRLTRSLLELGAQVHIFDPFIAPAPALDGAQVHPSYASLAEAADLVSFHVPLTSEGSHPTLDCWGGAELSQFQFAINTSRGNIWRPDVLSADNVHTDFVCDVWHGEPSPCAAHIARTSTASPHLAGHTHRAKYDAVAMVLTAAISELSVALGDSPHTELVRMADMETVERETAEYGMPATFMIDQSGIANVDRAMRGLARQSDPSTAFRRLRRASLRSQWCDIHLDGVAALNADSCHTLSVLGYALG